MAPAKSATKNDLMDEIVSISYARLSGLFFS